MSFRFRLRSFGAVMAFGLWACGGGTPSPQAPSEPEDQAAAQAASEESQERSLADEAAGSGRADSAPEQPQEPEAAEPTEETEEEPPTVELVSAGAEPRQALRYAPVAGESATLNVMMDMAVATSTGGQASAVIDMPPVDMGMQLKVTDVADDGNISYRFEVVSVKVGASDKVPEKVLKSLAAKYAELKNFSGHAVTTSRGIVETMQLDLPKQLEPSIKQLLQSISSNMRQLSNPFPSEPVGVGAEWKIISTSALEGMRLKQVTHTTLKAKEDSKMTLDLRVEQSAEPQQLKLPSLPQEAQAALLSLKGEGSGSLKTDLTTFAPERSEMRLSMDSEVVIKLGERTQQMKTRMNMKTLVTASE